MIIASSSIHSPTMSASIRHVHCRTREIEERTSGITGINTEVPAPCTPIKRTIEIGCSPESRQLPVEQNVTNIKISPCPVCAVKVIHCRYTHQIIEIYLVASIILLVSEIQFISHLVGEEESLSLSLCETHRIGCQCHCHHCHDR